MPHSEKWPTASQIQVAARKLLFQPRRSITAHCPGLEGVQLLGNRFFKSDAPSPRIAPGWRGCNEKLHVRILTANAFAKVYGKFDYDPWDLTKENYARLETFLDNNKISSLLEDLINF